MDYTKANDKLGTRSTRKIGNNTYLQRRDETTIAIKLHATDIITFHADGRTVLNSGGWKTVTTKARFNEYLGAYCVYPDKGVWFLRARGNHESAWPYEDGITIHEDGRVTGEGKDPKKTQKLRARVNKYSAAFVAALRAGKVKAPGAGDCLYCQMRAADGNDKGKTLGEVSRDTSAHSHIMLHLSERYFVPSLLWRALEVMGSSHAEKWAVGEIWEGKAPSWGKRDFVWLGIKKHLTRYILRQLGEVA